MLPAGASRLGPEEGHLIVLIQVALPTGRQRLRQCLARYVHERRLRLRVDAEVACVAEDDAAGLEAGHDYLGINPRPGDAVDGAVARGRRARAATMAQTRPPQALL